ncbi:uncharacterized protein LOC132620347 [Lycium barbarum]|uniref:uncharacterized protein LOC132620347 n=1 Tax=Lycium barbarum TaxID=112863 RepID=UPI00293E3055|nr:uncharacterized protein LOC132620347 [Lycium barbarum]
MKAGEESTKTNKNGESEVKKVTKPPFRPAKDDTKPLLQDPILRSDPIETEETLLLLPPFPLISKPNSHSH